MAQKPLQSKTFPQNRGNSGTDKRQRFRIQIKGERKRFRIQIKGERKGERKGEAQKVHTSQNFNFSLILANIEN